MQVIAIIKSGLETNGFDGLVVPGTCGCVIEDLSPGNCLSENCEAAYKHTHSQRPEDWVMSTKPEPMTDADIDRVIAECC